MANRTYRQLFNQKTTITSFGDWKFPAGIQINIDMVVAFVICLIPAAFVAPIIHAITPLSKGVAWIGLALVGGYLSTHIDLMGKSLPVFLADIIRYFFRSHHTNGWMDIKPDRKAEMSMYATISWIQSVGGDSFGVGMLPAKAHAAGEGPVRLQIYAPIDVQKRRKQILVTRSRSSGGPKHTKNLSTQLQPGVVIIERDSISWKSANSVPVFGGAGKGQSHRQSASNSIKF